MSPGPLIAATVVIAAAIGWSGRLMGGPSPLASGPAAMVAIVAIALSLVAAAGLLFSRRRWSLWLVVAIALGELALTAVLDLSTSGTAVAVAVAAVQVAAVMATAGGWVRPAPNPQGPPPLAVGLLLVLLGFPALVAAVNADGIAVAAVAGAVLVASAAIVYSRSGVPALWALRAMVPLGAALAAAATSLPGSLVVATVGLGLTTVSWSRVVRDAATPLLPLRSPGYRIPPELAPPEILDAAGLDDKGHRR